MGLLGGKKTYVASTVYNMAGPEAERINYLKTVVGSGVISNTGFSMSDIITNCYLNGPGLSCRRFHRWALRPGNYDQIGVPEVNIYSPNYDTGTIAANIPRGAGESVSLKAVKYGPGEFSYFAEQYVMANYQTRVDTAWTADYNVVTNEITITWDDATTTTFVAAVDSGYNHYYVYYELRNSTNFLGTFMWIYKIGTGNAAMDAMPVANPMIGQFLPFIPVRMKNNFLSATYKPDAYAIAKKAYKKATGGKKFDELVDLVADNESIDDIDYCYMVYGVSLNAIDRSARRYLFNFFEFLMNAQVVGETELADYDSSVISYNTEQDSFSDTRTFYMSDGGIGGSSEDPATTSSSPAMPPRPINQIRIKSSGSLDTKLDMLIKWQSITKTTGTGLKPGHKKGDVWWDPTLFRDTNGQLTLVNAFISVVDGADEVTINWQKGDDYWESITIVGMVHQNFVYGGKSVDIMAGVGLADTDESGFIVPIHYETMRSMSLIDSTQMMTAGTYLVFNSYEVVKQKWYQSTLFQIFIFVVMIVITVATMGAAAPGLLGAAGAIGATLGFTGMMATIVGAVVNALAAMILMQFLTAFGTVVFGAKIGAIIATVASVVAMSFGSSLMSGMSMATAWGNLMSVVNILQITSAVGNGIAGYINASVADLQGKSADMMAEYEKATAKIQKMWIDEFGKGDFHFDPNILTNNSMFGISELPQSFLERTLMTGSDIADMTNGMLSDFASLTLDVNAIRS